MKFLINRVIAIGRQDKIDDAEHFVSFGSVLARSSEYNQAVPQRHIQALIKEGLEVMDIDSALNNAEAYDNRRVNQVIHTWFTLLKQINISQALLFIESKLDVLDSRGLEAVGRATSGTKSLEYFRRAKEKALEHIHLRPSDYIRQTLSYMDKSKYSYSGFLGDIEQLIDIVGDPKKCRFSAADIHSVQFAATRALACLGAENAILKEKLTRFSKGNETN